MEMVTAGGVAAAAIASGLLRRSEQSAASSWNTSCLLVRRSCCRRKVRSARGSGREADVFRNSNVAHAKSANPRRIGGGGGRSRFVKTSNDHHVPFAIMCTEFSSEIAGDRTDCRGPSCRLEVKARTGAEFRNPEDRQTSNPPSKNTLLRHDFPPRKLVKSWPGRPRKELAAGGRQSDRRPAFAVPPFPVTRPRPRAERRSLSSIVIDLRLLNI